MDIGKMSQDATLYNLIYIHATMNLKYSAHIPSGIEWHSVITSEKIIHYS